ncbi:MAG: acetylornithine carbamoyltransferase [Oligoflexus sp.]
MSKHFLSIHDLVDPKQVVAKAMELKSSPFAYDQLGQKKTLGLLFLNPSLRTRLSSQKAAFHLGMQCFVLNVLQEGWKLEFNDATVMSGDTGEHIKEAAPVIAQYCDIIAIRSFPSLQDRDFDYQETILTKFIEYSGRPIISLESATRHPLQGLADVMTIEEHKKTARPKVVLSWAPHIKALPQSVPNSFAESCLAMNYDLVITHPKGYELAPAFIQGANIVYDQEAALKDADFVYVKNWSSYHDYGKILNQDPQWMMTRKKMDLTNQGKFMHCLPIRRNLVAEDAVLDHPTSLIIEQANNRTFAMQAILLQQIQQLDVL